MYRIAPLEPIDYLIIGHLTRDLLPNGTRLGGTAAYAALTARALGHACGYLNRLRRLPDHTRIKS